MSIEIYHNSPIKNCRTCFNCVKSWEGPEFDKCVRTGFYCDTELKYGGICGPDLLLWKPKPPRRSLRQFLYDIFLA
jgi:hypothetical protein